MRGSYSFLHIGERSFLFKPFCTLGIEKDCSDHQPDGEWQHLRIAKRWRQKTFLSCSFDLQINSFLQKIQEFQIFCYEWCSNKTSIGYWNPLILAKHDYIVIFNDKHEHFLTLMLQINFLVQLQHSGLIKLFRYRTSEYIQIFDCNPTIFKLFDYISWFDLLYKT